MPKIIHTTELEKLHDIIGRYPFGAEVDDLVKATGNKLSKRTLQRRLAVLLKEGRITTKRDWRAVKYLQVPVYRELMVASPVATYNASPPPKAPAEQNGPDIQIPLSSGAKEIMQYVRQPIQGRRPVGYNLAWLDSYYPNQTWYLPEELRQQLAQVGRSPAEQAAAGTFARDILNRLLIDLSWASSRLEGNTYSRLDTQRLIEFGEAADGKDAIETQMVLNHKAAIEYLVRVAIEPAVNTETIINLHALLSDGLLADPLACGKIRSRVVEIGSSVYLPLAVPQRLEELFHIIVKMAAEIQDPFEQSFFLMVHLPYLQPFEDVNKRVSRLAANIPLIQRNLSPLSFIDVPQRLYIDAILGVYELNRVELLCDVFAWAYERSCRQYVAVRSQLVAPDTFRLHYRAALSETVRAIVQGDLPLNAKSVRKVIPHSVAMQARDAFTQLVLNEFKTIHSGNAIRFGLRALEFNAWQERQPPASHPISIHEDQAIRSMPKTSRVRTSNTQRRWQRGQK